MGTDIHVVAEVKKNGRWTKVDHDFPDDRDYSLFGFLAGVRRDPPPPVTALAPHRGLPVDLSPEADAALEETADHSFSFVTVAELRAVDLTVLVPDYFPPHTLIPLSEWLGPKVVEAFKCRWADVHDVPPEDARLLFGFDS